MNDASDRIATEIDRELASPALMWRADAKQLRAVKVEGPDSLYPHDDEDNRKIYESTHFETEDKAWRHLLRDAEAAVSIAGHGIKDSETWLRNARERAGDAARNYAKVVEGMKARQI